MTDASPREVSPHSANATYAGPPAPKLPRTKILTSAVDRLAKRTSIAARSDDATVIHKVRVATRKLGSALRPYEAFVSEKTQSKIKKQLKKIRRSGGAVRDIDVAIECLDQISKGFSVSGDTEAISAVAYYRGRLDEQRAQAQQKFQSKCRKVEDAKFWQWCQKHLKSEIGKRSRRVKSKLLSNTVREAFETLCSLREAHLKAPADLERLHELRKALKTFRYSLAILPPRQIPEKIRHRADIVAQDAQDRLGAVIDVNNTIHLVSGIRSEQPSNKQLLAKKRDAVLAALGVELANRDLILSKGWKKELDLSFLDRTLNPPSTSKLN